MPVEMLITFDSDALCVLLSRKDLTGTIMYAKIENTKQLCDCKKIADLQPGR